MKKRTDRSAEERAQLNTDTILSCSDIGNAMRLIKHFGAELRYSYQDKRWLFFNGKRWKPDHGYIIQDLAKRTVIHIAAETLDIFMLDKERLSILKWAL